jgi:DNA repair protein RecN (Recombination protein N)
VGGQLILKELGIKNFVLIEELRLSFDKGLNVFTGETGAGKSIVLDAVGLLLGDRFPAEMVRQDAERSSIDGTFDVPATRAFKRWWADREFDAADELVIRREGYADGRSKAYLNDRPVTLATLSELGSFLVDVHGQNAHQHILKSATQLALLDRFAGLEDSVDAIEPLYRRWKTLAEELSAGQLSEQERMQRIDLLQFQCKEILDAKLKPNEDQDLSDRLPELKNAERLRVHAAAAYDVLHEAENSAVERLGQAQRSLAALAQMAPNAEPLVQELAQAISAIEQTAQTLQHLSERWTSDPEALEALLSRLDKLDRLKKKYGGTLDAVIAHGVQVEEDLKRLENADSYRKNLETENAAARKTLEKASADLSRKRTKASSELGDAVQKQLGDLGLKSAIFQCAMEKGDITLSGTDRVIFQWAPNPGEGIQPLAKIISGGEMSRVMLALKTVLADADAVPTLVFDEVDAGIGGLTAQSVGKKLRTLSKHHQILCVSHLSQIASCAQAHFQVSKRTQKSRTFATVVRLETEERLNELARLLGSQVTPTSLQHAKELLQQNQ